VIGVLLASTAFGLARPFADFLVGRSIPPPLFEELLGIVESDTAVEQVLSFRAIYSGPEEVLVMAKIHPAANINSEEFGRAMDALDHKIRIAVPVVADVFIDVTAMHTPRRRRTISRD
jgi:divalent metal cation (Fe/Co/Zn/Cd) transporter